jgi:hypothetical protein
MLPEKTLRQYDKALRLRKSFESDTVLLERKVARGKIGSLGPDGMLWSKDVGRRREEGHVLLMSIHRDEFDTNKLLDTLKATDSWKRDVPIWRMVEEADKRKAARDVRNRQMGLRYKASALYDNYVWCYKSRVNVPTQIG